MSNLKALQHPNIVKIIEAFFDANDDMMLVMEMCEQSLFHYMLSFQKEKGSAIPRNEGLLFFKQLCTGLHWIHAHKFMHRDIKPSNLLVNAADKTLKICDFGLSRTSHTTNSADQRGNVSMVPRARNTVGRRVRVFRRHMVGWVRPRNPAVIRAVLSETDIGVLRKILGSTRRPKRSCGLYGFRLDRRDGSSFRVFSTRGDAHPATMSSSSFGHGIQSTSASMRRS